jgi:predicted lipoprotein with Yx(FWY)xxD motif
MNQKQRFSVVLFVLLAGFFSSCNKDDDKADTEEKNSSGVKLTHNGTYGNIITDNKGVTLYFFSNDAAPETSGSACTDGCLDKWPVFYAEDLQVSSDLDPADFGTLARTDGSKQTTYKGWPLYYFSPTGDGVTEAAGDTKGEAVNNVWFVARPDYKIMIVNSQLTGHDGKSYLSDYTEGEGATAYFTDASGRTLYVFSKDYYNTNTFTASDLSNNGVWPVFYDNSESVPSIVNNDNFATIDVAGEKQLTYKGNPLYYFGQDEDRGDNKGVSFPAPGVWPVVYTTTEEAPAPPEEVEATVKLTSNTTYGDIITDGEGRSLYFFTKDVNGIAHCTEGCLLVWPVFYTEKVVLEEGSELSADDFDEITLDDDTKQTTYKGWPLYYYSSTADGNIEATGNVGGDGVNDVWYVAKESYDLMVADAQLVGHDGKNYTSDYVEGDGVTKYFTDIEGRTIYMFTKDAKNTNNFTASDLSNNSVWPIFYAEIDDLPSYLDKSNFGEITVYGNKQLTYKGWPLYYFGQDAERGDNKGISFPSPGVWPIVNSETAEAPE